MLAKITAVDPAWAWIPSASWQPMKTQFDKVEKNATGCHYMMTLLTKGLAGAKLTMEESYKPQFYNAVLQQWPDIDLLRRKVDLLSSMQELQSNMGASEA